MLQAGVMGGKERDVRCLSSLADGREGFPVASSVGDVWWWWWWPEEKEKAGEKKKCKTKGRGRNLACHDEAVYPTTDLLPCYLDLLCSLQLGKFIIRL